MTGVGAAPGAAPAPGAGEWDPMVAGWRSALGVVSAAVDTCRIPAGAEGWKAAFARACSGACDGAVTARAVAAIAGEPTTVREPSAPVAAPPPPRAARISAVAAAPASTRNTTAPVTPVRKLMSSSRP